MYVISNDNGDIRQTIKFSLKVFPQKAQILQILLFENQKTVNIISSKILKSKYYPTLDLIFNLWYFWAFK